jgi:hypothetical protein
LKAGAAAKSQALIGEWLGPEDNNDRGLPFHAPEGTTIELPHDRVAHHPAGGPYTIVLPAQLAGVLNGMTANFAGLATPANASIAVNSEVVVVTSVSATQFTCVTTKTHNGTLGIPFGIWSNVYNIEKDISGENDGSSGAGVASAVEVEYNGGAAFGSAGYDRARNLEGKGRTIQTGLTITQFATSLTLGNCRDACCQQGAGCRGTLVSWFLGREALVNASHSRGLQCATKAPYPENLAIMVWTLAPLLRGFAKKPAREVGHGG